MGVSLGGGGGGNVSSHEADTTNIHGIADTSALETSTGAQTKADAAETAANTYTDAVSTTLGHGLIIGLPMLVGEYYTACNHNGLGAGTTGLNERSYAAPYLITRDCTLDRIGIEVTGAGEASCVVRLGIYGNTGVDYRPGARILDAGTVAGDSTGVKEITISQAITAGIVWLTAAPQNAATTRPSFRHIQQGWHGLIGSTTAGGSTSVMGWRSAAGVSGALPDPFGTPNATAVSAQVPAFWIRASA